MHPSTVHPSTDWQRSPRIKICGIKDVDTAQAVARAGADALGLVFYPPSPRWVDPVVAAHIVHTLPAFVSSVGLWVDPSADAVREVIGQMPLQLLQFHGNEPPEFCRQFGLPYIKAVRMKPGLDLLEYAARYADACALLCDAWSARAPGGTGETFDWADLPAALPLPLILSGGLSADNVAAAVSRVQPWAVDVSSGVEQQRGVKDLALVQRFIAAVHGRAD